MSALSLNRCISRVVCGAAVVAGGLLLSPWTSSANAQTSPLPYEVIDVHIDSGEYVNQGSEPIIVWSDVIEMTDATWLRLEFEDTTLGWDAETSENSILRVTSLLDGGTQHHTARTIEQWQNTSAYFNGDVVTIELIAAPNGLPCRVVIDAVQVGMPPFDSQISSICGPTDDRELSDDPRAGRLLPVGCTAWIFSDSHHQFGSAGHCIAFGGTSQIVEFNVPLSNSNGSLNHPGPEDQYAMDPASVQYTYVTIGDDWSYFGCFANSETDLTAYQAQGDFYDLADAPPAVNGQTIRITGFGTVSYPVPLEWNQAQKTHTGPYFAFFGTTLQYQVDTSGGNSGSPVFCEDTGQVIGVHTHAGCTSGGGANQGTGVNHSGWQNALQNPRGVCAPFELTSTDLIAGRNATLQALDATPGFTVYFIYSLSGAGEHLLPVLGVTLGVSQPRLGGSAMASGSGVASLTTPVPGGSRGANVWLQAAENGRVSNVIQKVVQ